jgi:hypothetical protein
MRRIAGLLLAALLLLTTPAAAGERDRLQYCRRVMEASERHVLEVQYGAYERYEAGDISWNRANGVIYHAWERYSRVRERCSVVGQT